MIAIIGAGLTGLLIANKLKKSGREVCVIEARNRIGGRIYTVGDGTPVEMGATWFGPQHQNLISLINELGIPFFEQYMEGKTFFEPFATTPPQQIEIPAQEPSFRVAGGTSQIIKALAEGLTPGELHLNQPVRALDFQGHSARVKTDQLDIEADVVISTLPPALLVSEVSITPGLPDNLVDIARNTHTWMQDSIKAAVIYNSPFWRNQKLSGTIFSNAGPLNEFYDHTDYTTSKFALCGFINEAFFHLSPNEREGKVRDQLCRTFGKQGTEYSKYKELLWANEKHTKHSQSNGLYPHQNSGHGVYQNSWYDGKLIIGGTETSPVYGGYMEGAVYSATSIINKIIQLFI